MWSGQSGWQDMESDFSGKDGDCLQEHSFLPYILRAVPVWQEIVYKKDSEFTPQMKEDICNILQCAGLIHDIGNPPFGHFGEDVIREWFERKLPLMTYHGKPMEQVMSRQMVEDLYHFEGNAQAFRLVTKLHFLVDERGMNLTYALLSTIVKYPVPSTGIDLDSGDIKTRKMGYYLADEKMYSAKKARKAERKI